ncbi:MAG: UDP-N-acetyl-D-mannosamine dehydrogenase [Gammaproteobacteria bacterium]
MIPTFNKISVIGLGYIGLPTAAVFANRGVDVIGVEVDPKKVEVINQGDIPIEEPDLDVMVRSAVGAGSLRATTTPEPAEAFMVAVPTPLTCDHKPDVSYVESAAEMIAPVLEKGNLVVLESTSPVGTTEMMAAKLAELRPDLSFPQDAGSEADVNIAYCPERVLPGRILFELVNNDRVIGGMSARCSERAAALYKTFVSAECIPTTVRTAEMAKLVENSFRDVNIAFANELSVICETHDVNVWELIALANRHPRVNILQPGPGVGGHCIAVDPWFIVDGDPENARIIRTAREINDAKPQRVADQVNALVSGMEKPTIACLGLAFKADIDDLRESPAVTVVNMLASNENAHILAVEPFVDTLPKELQGKSNVSLVDTTTALDRADVIVLLVNHSQFRYISRSALQSKPVVDTRGMLELV